jgi:hypothetical protein
MSSVLEEIKVKTRDLPALEKMDLVDELLSQLDEPDELMTKNWLREVRERREAYRAGKMSARSYDDIISGLIKK